MALSARSTIIAWLLVVWFLISLPHASMGWHEGEHEIIPRDLTATLLRSFTFLPDFLTTTINFPCEEAQPFYFFRFPNYQDRINFV